MKKLNQKLLLMVAVATFPLAAKAQLIPTEATDWTPAMVVCKQGINGAPRHYFFVGESISLKGDFDAGQLTGTLLAVHLDTCEVAVEGERRTIPYTEIQKVWGDARWGFSTRRFNSRKFEFYQGKVKTVCD